MKQGVIYNIPLALMIYALFCLCMFGSDFLVKHQILLTAIDTILFMIASVHIVKYSKNYFKYQLNCYYGCLMFLFLERTDIVFRLSDKIYLTLYASIILFVILKSISDNRK